MRWDHLRTDLADGAEPLPLALPRAVVRTFDSPGFAGMTFYEISAKTIISRVPDVSRVPFRWTINPYRGCSHACAYCLAAETPVLMADGRVMALAELRVGDQIVGTIGEGWDRRYVQTSVLAHWSTVKPAWRITLDDGRHLVASADHRFLSDRGWKFVGGSPDHRPYLTIRDALVATEGRVEPDRRVIGRRAIVSVEATGYQLPMFDVTTGTGDFIANGVVSHNCFARNTHTYLDLDAGRDFDTKIVVKVNAADRLRRELASPRWRGDHIAMGTNVDCYQRAEGRYQLMRGIIAALRDFANPFSVLTKGTMITRDLDVLRQAAEVTSVTVGFSIGFVDDWLWREVEPGTPSPRRRLDAVRRFADAGFPVSVLLAPVLPGLTDSQESIDRTVAAIAAAGAVGVSPITLHLRPGAREWYLAWLGRVRPDLARRYRELYGRGSYAPQADQREIGARVAAAARRYRIDRSAASDQREISARDRRSSDIRQAENGQLALL